MLKISVRLLLLVSLLVDQMFFARCPATVRLWFPLMPLQITVGSIPVQPSAAFSAIPNPAIILVFSITACTLVILGIFYLYEDSLKGDLVFVSLAQTLVTSPTSAVRY